mgnify:CR=1 FL=1
MKNRKFLGVFSFLLSVCLLFATLPFVSANADGEGTSEQAKVKVYEAESCKIERLDLGDVKVEVGDNSLISKGLTVKKGETEVKVYVDGTINTETDKCWVAVSGSDSDTERKVTSIKFDTLKDSEDKAVYTVSANDKTAEVTVYDKEQETADKILVEKTDVALDASKIKIDAEKKRVTLEKAEIWKILDETSVIRDADDLSARIYLRTPGGTWPSSATKTLSGSSSDVELTVSSRGDYHFYVLFTDNKGNTTEKDSELVEKVDGFYKVEGEGEAKTETKVIPIFSFTYTPDETVKVKCSNTDKVKKGYEGQIQKSITYTLENATDKDVEFVLMFKAEGAAKYDVAKNGVDADFDASKFTKSSLEFTPLKKGEYSFRVNAEGMTDAALKEGADDNVVIRVTDSVTIVKRENTAFTDFVKNNWKSLIFLGIAVLCLIAIIVIACWKPKDKTAVKRQVEDSADKEDKNAAKASETKNAEDEATETVDTTEETVEAKEENAAVEETAEVAPEAEVTEEAKVEEAIETPVENAEEVANETPAENAEANAGTPAESSETPVETPAETDNGDKAE